MPRLRLLPPAQMATTPEQCVPIMERLLRRGGLLGIDTETTGLRKIEDHILFWSLATEDERFLFPANMLPVFEPLFRNPNVSWALANAKYDMHMLKNAGYTLEGKIYDIIPMDAFVDDTRRHGLKHQSLQAYEARWGDFKELFLDPYTVSTALGLDKNGFRKFKNMSGGDKLLYVFNQNPNIVLEYGSCDAYFTRMRCCDLMDALGAEDLATELVPEMKTLMDYYELIEVPMTKTLWRMERRGVSIDTDHIKKVADPAQDRIKSLEHQLQKLCGKRFSPKSTQQVSWVLFDKDCFGVAPVSYTGGGIKKAPSKSTSEKDLEVLRSRHLGKAVSEFCGLLLEHRKLTKLYGTYIAGIQKVLSRDGRLRTSFNQAGARTGRFSSSDPNVQNIPRPGDSDPLQVRSAFVASPGMDMIDRDYPQVEFRVAAVLADEEKMMDPIRNGWDIHAANAAIMFDLDYDAVLTAKNTDKDKLTAAAKRLVALRGEAKTTGLAVLYGKGIRSMAADLKVSEDRSRELQDRFFTRFSKIAEDIAGTEQWAHEYEYTFTMLGRKRRMHRINSGIRGIEAAEERQAYNTRDQGSAAELIKLAMLRVDHDPVFQQAGGELLLTVHDELVAEAPKLTSKQAEEALHEGMGDPLKWGPLNIDFPVPLTPDGGRGYRWSELH